MTWNGEPITPEQARGMRVSPHFVDRCRERGIVESDPAELFASLIWAKSNGRDDFAEMAKRIEDAEYWRFSCLDGIFYAIFLEGRYTPSTVMTQGMYRQKRWAAKRRKRGHAPIVKTTDMKHRARDTLGRTAS